MLRSSQSATAADVICALFENEEVLGFDTEWPTTDDAGHGLKRRGKVALIQISGKTDVALFHIAKIMDKKPLAPFPAKLKAIIESEHCIKVGAKISDDALHLMDDYGISAGSWMDVRELAKDVQPNLFPEPITKISLQTVVDRVCTCTLSYNY